MIKLIVALVCAILFGVQFGIVGFVGGFFVCLSLADMFASFLRDSFPSLFGPSILNKDGEFNRDAPITFGKYKEKGLTWRTLPLSYLNVLYAKRNEEIEVDSSIIEGVKAELACRKAETNRGISIPEKVDADTGNSAIAEQSVITVSSECDEQAEVVNHLSEFDRDALVTFGSFRDVGFTWRTLPEKYLQVLHAYSHKNCNSEIANSAIAELTLRRQELNQQELLHNEVDASGAKTSMTEERLSAKDTTWFDRDAKVPFRKFQNDRTTWRNLPIGFLMRYGQNSKNELKHQQFVTAELICRGYLVRDGKAQRLESLDDFTMSDFDECLGHLSIG